MGPGPPAGASAGPAGAPGAPDPGRDCGGCGGRPCWASRGGAGVPTATVSGAGGASNARSRSSASLPSPESAASARLTALLTDWLTSSSSDMRAASAATRPCTPSRMSVSRRTVSACRVLSRLSLRSAPSWMAVARAVASSSTFLACDLALASAASAFFLVSLVSRSASVRAAVRVLSASFRAAEIVRSACSCAAVSIRSACSRESARTRSDSCRASARSLEMSSSALLFWAFASSSASLRIWAMRSLTSSCAGLPASACWRTVDISRRKCSLSSSDRARRCSSSRISLLRRATKSSTWRRL